MNKTVFIPILTRNHNNYLKHYLRCIEELDYPKNKIVIYINTNNNDDDTVKTLLDWTQRVHKDYRKVIFEHGDYSGLKKEMGWQDGDGRRLHVMSIIRQRSLDLCKNEKCDYFFPMDTDNWVEPCTLKYLIHKGLPLIAPFLKDYAERNLYANYFYTINEWGFIGEDPNEESLKIWHRVEEMRGTYEVPLIHCTYLLDCKYINNVHYYDGGNQWEFITFANSARAGGVKQYICNERLFGFVRYDTIVDDPNCYQMMVDKCLSSNNMMGFHKEIEPELIPIAIFTSYKPKYIENKKQVERTWLREIDNKKYFPFWVIGDPSKTNGMEYFYDKTTNTLYTNSPDTYDSLTLKCKYLMKWFIENSKASHLWRVDDDSYINPEAFNKYTACFQHDFTGRFLYLYDVKHPFFDRQSIKFVSGCGYCISRSAVSAIVDELGEVVAPQEDVMVSVLLDKHKPDASWYNEDRIDPFSECKMIDNLLIGHHVKSEDMETMHNYYKDGN